MAFTGVRIRGLREMQRAFRKLALEIGPELRGKLAQVVEPIAQSARARQRWVGASAGTIGPRVTVAGAAVTQRARKVTGQRPDYGALQMRESMIPALEEHGEDIEAAAGAAIDDLTREAGFH